MIDLEGALTTIRLDMLKLGKLEQEKIELTNYPMRPAERDEREQELKQGIERQRDRVRRVLRELIVYPPQHVRHTNLIDPFQNVAPFDKSVFIMTKYPDPANPGPADPKLNAVIQAVRDGVTAKGYTPRVATDTQFHAIVWDNVELYLLGCQRGIAIVEDKYVAELNPNVAMEWGWMRGMGRNVLYLVEKSFAHQRADWGGLIEAKFAWDDPVNDIKAAIAAWLP